MGQNMNLSRRQALVLGAAASTLSLSAISTAALNSDRQDALRIGHITDVHLNEQRNAIQGASAMFDHMFGDDWKPDLVLNTGDSVMAVDGECSGRQAALQTRLWKKLIQEKCPAPMFSCLGNHDLWSGHQPSEEVAMEKAGPQLMIETLGLPQAWYSFDKQGWHFVVLSSAWPTNGHLNPEQWQWLKDDLANTSGEVPICVLSHYPILSVTGGVYGNECRKGNENVIPGSWIHADCWELSELFRHYPNVKLCLSGHMHTWDRCEYRGVWYICGGAVSGSWWDGSELGFPPCYGRLNLFPDGSFDYQFVDYGWNARQWKGSQLTL